ncbi:MAG: PRC-barrel domain-containing protein [Actinomycetota bacterium]|nr:PRC-barrel domain-containing protein [Actinomycetota bacterium]
MAVPPMPGLWNWPNPLPDFEFAEPAEGEGGPNYAGYKVVANDGEIGHVDSFAIAPDESHIVVDTGGWLFGRMSLIPAAAVRVVNDESQTIQVDLTKQQIKDAPEYDKSAGYGPYRDSATDYYGPMI